MATPQLVKNSNDGSRPGYKGIIDWAKDAWDSYKKYKDVIDPVAKTVGSLGKAYIDYKSQKELNELTEEAYNQYMRDKQAAGQEAQAAVDLNLTPMQISNVPTTKADVSDFTLVAARGGLMNLPTRHRKRYYGGTDQEDIEIMEPESLGDFELQKEEGVNIGEQVFHDTGDDRTNAQNVWQSGAIDQEIYQMDFEIFFKSGDWQDHISRGAVQGDTQMASSDMGDPMENADEHSMRMFNGKKYNELTPIEIEIFEEEMLRLQNKFMATGGIAGLRHGGRPGYAQGSGIMNLGGLEKDYRTTGGFVPIGAYEKKDDVPARLSKNEFVMTADAVRAAGGGSINKGAQRMYDTMKHLEARPEAKRMTA